MYPNRAYLEICCHVFWDVSELMAEWDKPVISAPNSLTPEMIGWSMSVIMLGESDLIELIWAAICLHSILVYDIIPFLEITIFQYIYQCIKMNISVYSPFILDWITSFKTSLSTNEVLWGKKSLEICTPKSELASMQVWTYVLLLLSTKADKYLEVLRAFLPAAA